MNHLTVKALMMNNLLRLFFCSAILLMSWVHGTVTRVRFCPVMHKAYLAKAA